jgi:hypothetical protein
VAIGPEQTFISRDRCLMILPAVSTPLWMIFTGCRRPGGIRSADRTWIGSWRTADAPFRRRGAGVCSQQIALRGVPH